MTLAEFRQLKKLMTLATSANDHEALACLRAATALLARAGFTWEMALNRVITVVREVEPAPDADPELEAAFDLALRGARGSFRATLESIREQHAATGRLSPRQRALVEEAAERAARLTIREEG